MSGSRRKFLKSVAAAGAVTMIPNRSSAATQGQSGKPHIVVIGAGAFGGWTALHLLRSGAQVTLVDAWGPGNSRASSGGETRVIRATYGSMKIYTAMAARALALWQEAQAKWKQQVFFPRGVLWMTGKHQDFERESIPYLKAAGIPYELLTKDEAAKRWPQINFEGIELSVFEPESGYLLARQSCGLVMETFRAEGGVYRQAQARIGRIASGRLADVDLGNGQRLAADQFVFACGPWLAAVVPGFAKRITPTRQEVFFFGTPAGDARFDEENLPVWAENDEALFYGIPGNRYRGFKIADDTRGAVVDPTTQERKISEKALAAARAYIDRRFPGMRGAPLLESRVCQYENSPDSNFYLDRLPEAQNAWVLGGGSGHGFKHGPALGELAAAVVLGRTSTPPEFKIERTG